MAAARSDDKSGSLTIGRGVVKEANGRAPKAHTAPTAAASPTDSGTNAAAANGNDDAKEEYVLIANLEDIKVLAQSAVKSDLENIIEWLCRGDDEEGAWRKSRFKIFKVHRHRCRAD